MSNLKPCPFCGGTDLEVVKMPHGAAWVKCNPCEIEGPAIYFDKRTSYQVGAAKSILAWNSRASDATAEKLADALRELVESGEEEWPGRQCVMIGRAALAAYDARNK